MEELNLARAVLAKQCQVFSREGTDSFIMDYFGTGDSEGEFEQAGPQEWLNDVLTVGQWLVAQGYSQLILLGVRVGALLIGAHQQLLHSQLPIAGQVLWKPIANGKLFVSQLIRLKQANQLINQTGDKTNVKAQILAGDDTEIAGYVITANFLNQLEALAITPQTQWLAPTHWLELAANALPPVTKRLTDGIDNITTHLLATPQFWQVPEVFDLPELTSLGHAIVSGIDNDR
ncbi:hypothetical protein [Colwellia sp. MEBiC06753]